MDLTHSRKIALETRRRMRRWNFYLVPISLGLALLSWHLIAWLGGYPAYILPGPAQVWARFISALFDGRLLYHIAVTLGEVLAGLALGVMAASEISYSFVNDTYVWGLYDNMWPDFMPDYGTTPESRGVLPAFGNAGGKYFLQQSSWPYNTGNKEYK